MHNSVLQISNDSKSLVGTGFVIDKDGGGVFVATCGHVVNSCGQIILVEGNEAKIIINSYDSGLDLAVLYVEGLTQNALSVVEDKAAETVNVIGFCKLLSDPKRESINDIPVKTNVQITKTPILKIDALKLSPEEPISKGYSGSPVICSKCHKVIGIVNIQAGPETNYAICVKHLLEIYDLPLAKSTSPLSRETTKINLSTILEEGDYMFLKKQFEKNIEESLQSFSSQQTVWVEPKLHSKSEESNSMADEDIITTINDIINKPQSIVVTAMQQYGLTCLAHYLVKEAWVNTNPSFWLYLDVNELKPYAAAIRKHITKKIRKLGLSMEDVECVILDEFSDSIENANKILNELCRVLGSLPVIVMMTIIENPILRESIEFPEDRDFGVLHLWALPRHDVRQVVSEYNGEKYVGDENAVVSKVIADLEVLNIPRTPLNCLTILKVYEAEFDDSPVNRTEMIRRVLYLLFNIDDIPRYKSRPDLKDTEYILGYFCEKMIRSSNYFFSRQSFLQELNDFCESSEIDIETAVIFDVLFTNNIIVMRGQRFCFKFNYWVFYFAAHRMHHNPDFTSFILQDMNYASYPELIEFYTGIDRRRDNALEVLIKDIKDTCDIVEQKCGLPSEFNIYNMAQWKPSEDTIEQMHDEISSGALNSNLPDVIKDQYADESYDRTRPLTQEVHKILEKYSLLRLMKGVQAGAKALRNSDYSSPSVRHKLLEEILRSWEQIIKVLIVLSPFLSKYGHAKVDGACFVLGGGFDETPEGRFNEILHTLPVNVVDWYKDDLFSKKMGSLLYKHKDNKDNELIKHILNLLIIKKRPKGWGEQIEKDIISEHKNSFYLLDMYHILRTEYQYSFASNDTLKILKKLIKMVAAKHELGIKKPGSKLLNKDTFDYALPERDPK